MPLPLRAPSVRQTATEPKSSISRSARPTIGPQQSKTKPSEASTKAKSERQKPDAASSATSTRESTNGSQASSSRIPSPYKRNTSSQSSHSQVVKPGPNKPPDKGHVRQRSAVTPLLTAPKRFAHSRSISAVSINTTTSTSSNDATKPVSRPGLDPLAHRSGVARPKYTSTQSAANSSLLAIRPASTYAQIELVQNELLQLSAVYKQSSQTMQAYQQSIEGFLATKQSEMSSKRAVVQARKQNFCAALNLLGLDSWLGAEGAQKTCQSLQNLSVAVRDLQNLESIFEGSDGLAAAFVDWQQNICSRESSTNTGAMSSDFITLHTVYENRLVPEIRRFRQQVSSALASLSNLPECPPDTSLASMIQGHTSLAMSLTSQCQVMLQIGEVLVANHRQWLQDEVKAAVRGVADSTPQPGSGPIWDV